jgi:hypothetical protein
MKAITMKSHIFIGLLTFPLLLFLNHGAARSAEKYRQFQLEGLTVTLSLERHAETVEKANWPDEHIQLTSQSVTVNGKTIHELLLEANIFPDVEAFTIVYVLNPEIQDLRKLAVAQIKIPKVVHGAKLNLMFAQHFQVWLTVEKEKKQQFNDSVQKLLSLIETTSNFGTGKFESLEKREEFLRALKNSSEILEGIAEQVRERYGRTIPKVVLTELGSETQLLIGVLTAKAASTAKFDQRDFDKVKEVETDLKRKARIFKEVAAAGDPPTQYDSVEVSVKALQAGRLIPNLRIYFVPKFSRDPEGSLGMLTTEKPDAPAKGRIYEGDYCFWAAKDPAKTPVTNEHCEALYLNYNIELTVIK